MKTQGLALLSHRVAGPPVRVHVVLCWRRAWQNTCSLTHVQAQRLESELRDLQRQTATASLNTEHLMAAEQARAKEAVRELDVMRAGAGQARNEALQALKVGPGLPECSSCCPYVRIRKILEANARSRPA